MSKSNYKKILILMTGSIAAYKVCSLISKLVQNDFEVRVVMSSAAQKFIGPTTIEGLIGTKPYLETFEPGHAMEHIHLARWADLILMAPATAHTINKIGYGLGDDLITTLFLAHDFQKPFLIAPAMNTKMYLHPTTQSSIQKLKNMGLNILETASGVLACGEVGYGRLLEPDLMYGEVLHFLNSKNESSGSQSYFKKSKILITAGGTQEDIDDVRVISNKSTGRTASLIAEEFIQAGFDVTYLCSLTSALPHSECQIERYRTFQDLQSKMIEILKNDYAMVIHAAAVSDYSVDQNHHGKIDSSADVINLKLKKNPKLIQMIKEKNPSTILVGFKLTSRASDLQIEDKVKKLFDSAKCDFVVHNDWSTVHTHHHLFNLYDTHHVQKHLTIGDLSQELIQQALKRGEQ